MTKTPQADRDKLQALAERIARAEETADSTRGKDKSDTQSADPSKVRMVRIGTDFIATILASVGLGWFVDQQFGIAPWGMIGVLLVGFIAACWGLVEAASGQTKSKVAAGQKE